MKPDCSHVLFMRRRQRLYRQTDKKRKVSTVKQNKRKRLAYLMGLGKLNVKPL